MPEERGEGEEGEEEIVQVCVCMRSVICLENARVFQLWGFLVISCPRWRRSWKKRSLQEPSWYSSVIAELMGIKV